MTILKKAGKMNEKDLALIFNIQEETVKRLAKTNQLPCEKVKNRRYFDFEVILKHFEALESELEGGTAW